MGDAKPTCGTGDIDPLDLVKCKQTANGVKRSESSEAEQAGLIVGHDYVYSLSLLDDVLSDHQIRVNCSPVKASHLDHQIS